jgi:hypothetical protein
MALSSPGTQITIIDESQYLPAAPNSIPLVVIATAQNKINASGTGVAAATTKANAGKLYAVTSQRDLITYFGNPFFYKTTNGTPIQGYELNEYGLLAAYSTLGSTNLVYAIRADIDLAALVGKTSRPSSAPDNGSWWLDTDASQWGIFEFNATTGTFTSKTPIVITDYTQVESGAPKASVGNTGDYAVVLTDSAIQTPTDVNIPEGSPDLYSTYWYKKLIPAVGTLNGSTPSSDYVAPSSEWVAVGSAAWQDAWPVAQTSTIAADTIVDGSLIISNNVTTATFTGTINNGSSATTAGTTLTVTSISSTVALKVGTLLNVTDTSGTKHVVYITALGTVNVGGTGTYTINKPILVGAKVATVDGRIDDGTNSSTTAGSVLTVTSVTSGELSVGTLLTGVSEVVSAGSFVIGKTYKISVVGNTDFVALSSDPIQTADVVGYAGSGLADTADANSGTAQSKLVITGWTALTNGNDGLVKAGMYLSGVGVTAGTLVTSQTHNDAGIAPTYVSGAALSSYTLALSALTGIQVGQTIIAYNSDGTTLAGIPAGTTVTDVSTDGSNTITLSNPFAAAHTNSTTVYRFYTPITDPTAANGKLGIYATNVSQNKATLSVIQGQPAVGTSFIAQGVGTGGTTGKATTSIADGTYITALGTGTGGTGTYTVSTDQYVTFGTVTGYQASMSGQDATSITLNSVNATTAASIKNLIDDELISFLSTSVVDSKVNLKLTKAGGSIVIGGTDTTLGSLGLTAGTYNAPAMSYGASSAQPLWREKDNSPRPTGSVWVKTNSVNNGTSIVMSQYSTTTGTYTAKTVSVAVDDKTVNNSLDSTGGKAIPLNTVYAKVDSDPAAPLQLFYRAQTGESSWTGTVSNPTFDAGAVLRVQVSQPGSSTYLPSDSTTYAVQLPSTGTPTASDFVTAWTTADIKYTTCSLDSVTGAIVLTHTEGGTIRITDSYSVYAETPLTSPLIDAGFQPYNMAAASGTLGVKYGTSTIVTITNPTGPLATTTTGNGINLTLDIGTLGHTPTFVISTPGTLYAVGDIVTVTGGNPLSGAYQVKVTSVDSAGGVLSLEWHSGLATPYRAIELSAWEPFDYISSTTEPVNTAANGTPWFYSVVNQVDIMVNVGSVWKGYQNVMFDTTGIAYAAGTNATNATGPICSASEPTLQTDGSDLVHGDLWLDTGDLENYPVIYRWESVSGLDQWVLIDNTDQQTENGIVFADARWGSNGSIDPVGDSIPTIVSLLSSNYVDLDAPDASTYPQGTLLFNTRRSGYNVKKFATNYFTSATYGEAGDYNASATTNIANLPKVSYTWVTASGNKADGSPYMGRKAQRAMVVAAMKSVVDTSSELREEATSFNLIAAPGYPELQPNMVSLNNDRNETAYIIGDTPLRLENDANALTAWATNAKGAVATGEDGLVSRNTYLGIYYPSGITTDLTGSTVVVPASHMMLRTIIHNDTVAYPWFAPAGMRRGTIDNATNIGYIDAASGEFQTTKNRVALRDVQYTNFINPIAYFQNIGLLNYGNKNSYDSQSALDRTNVARLICYIRDRLQVAVRPFIFEPNDSMTRTQVRDVVKTLLADIKTKRGVYDYLVVCDESNNTAARIDRSELWIDIAIEPVKAVEFIYIPVRIMNTGEIAGL